MKRIYYFRGSLNNISSFVSRLLNVFGALQMRNKQIHYIEEKHKKILENMKEGYIEFDPVGKIAFFNQVITDIFKIPSKILYQTDFRKIIDRSDLTAANQAFKHVWVTGRSIKDLQCKVTNQCGNKINIEMSISLLTDGQHNQNGFLCIVRDITKRKQNERELDRLRNEFKDVFNSSPSMLICVNEHRKITRCNRKTEEILEVNEPQLYGQVFESVFSNFQPVQEKLVQVINQGKPSTINQLASKIAGNSCFWDIVIYPLITNGHQGAVLRFDDVSQRVLMEETMVQTEKMMSLGGLAAGMAHEINNPLGGISMSIQNIKRRLAPGESRNEAAAKSCGINLTDLQQYLEKRHITKGIKAIQDSVLRASNIITNMLHFSRQSDYKRTDPRGAGFGLTPIGG